MEDFFSLITSVNLQKTLLPFKILSIFLFLFFAGFIIYVFRRVDELRVHPFRWFKEFRSFKSYESIGLARQWQKTERRLVKGWEAEAKLAIIEADKLLDEVLERMGYQGENLTERLKRIDEKILPNFEEIQLAHKIRDDIVHDPDYKLAIDHAKIVMEAYEEALRKLEAL